MSRVTAIGWHTFLEAIRDRVLYLLLFFGLFVFAASRLLSPLALGEGRRITIDVGMGAISFFGCLLTIFVGHQLIFREIERKTLYFLFARPITRAEFVFGKYFGLALTLTAATAAMGLLLTVLLFASSYAFGWALFQAIAFVLLELLLLAAIAVLLACITSPMLAGLLTLAAYGIGHGSGEIATLVRASGEGASAGFLRVLLVLVPRLDLYHDTGPILFDRPWTWIECGWAAAYALTYTTACLLAASALFSRRQLLS